MPTQADRDEDQDEQQEELHGSMSFLDHLEELRSRIFKTLIAVTAAFIAFFVFADSLVAIVARPIVTITGQPLNFMTLTEPFNLSVKVSFIGAALLTSPFIMAQIWLFIAPGLYKHERRYAAPFIIFSSLLFITGGLFGYFVAFPFTIKFLVDWGRQLGMTAVLSAREYFDLFLVLELALGIVFEIPAVIFILSRIGLVTGSFLLKNTKYAVLISFVLAAVITPSGDIPTMMVFALPMIVLYMIGVVIAFIFGKKRRTDAEA